MRKIKLDSYDLGVVINGLYSCRPSGSSDGVNKIDSLLLWLLDILEGLKPGRKKRIEFNADQIKLIILCLNDWRSSFLSGGNRNQAEAITEVMAKFIG